MDKKIDQLLSNALSKGDERKIREIYEYIYYQYYKLVAFCIAKYCTDIELIKDLTNDVFLNFFENVLNVKSSVKYYLLSTARNIVINYLKKENNIILVDDINKINISFDNKNSHYLYNELVDDLRGVLSDYEVSIIIKHSVDGLTFNELEKIYKIKSKTINKTFERAVKKFKNSERSKKYAK